jgi:predicted nucleic acid-binding Zn ribbon protein
VRSATRPQRRNAEPETAASLMSAVVARVGGEHRAREHRIFAAYQQAVGKRLSQQTRAERLHEGTLFVRVSSSALAHQITLLKREILMRMQPLVDPGTVTDLRTRVGPLDARF